MVVFLEVVVFIKGVVVDGMEVTCEAVAVGFVVVVWIVAAVVGFAVVDGGMVVIFVDVGDCVVDLAVVDGSVDVFTGMMVVVVGVLVVVGNFVASLVVSVVVKVDLIAVSFVVLVNVLLSSI